MRWCHQPRTQARTWRTRVSI